MTPSSDMLIKLISDDINSMLVMDTKINLWDTSMSTPFHGNIPPILQRDTHIKLYPKMGEILLQETESAPVQYKPA